VLCDDAHDVERTFAHDLFAVRGCHRASSPGFVKHWTDRSGASLKQIGVAFHVRRAWLDFRLELDQQLQDVLLVTERCG